MFYSETLLSKTGPLARVWLSANIERKLNKTHILQSNIQDSVNAIVDQGQAPLALRLSGQLLLGVVRIYSRKARYLLDDCNEALHKIKMTFRPGNVDLPANQTSAANPASLTLPDVLTELDLLAPLPDPSLLFSQPFDGILGADPNLLDFGSSQRLSSSIDRHRRASTEPLRLEDDIGLELDLGNDVGTPSIRERDIEFGRDAPPPRSLAEDLDDTLKLYDADDLELDLGEDEPVRHRDSTILPDMGNTDLEQDIAMGGLDDDLGFAMPDMDDIAVTSVPLQRGRQKESLSPLSSIRSSVERDFEQTMQQEQASVNDPDDASVHHAQRAKRRRVLQPDADTELHSNQIRAQQNDRSKILKPASFIPRDPLLLTLMNMQKNGEFVSNILSDGRSKGWAPELRGILSLEIIRTPGPLKRKRDTGITSPDVAITAPQIQVQSEADDELAMPVNDLTLGADTTLGNGEFFNLAADDDMMLSHDDDDVPAQTQSRGESEQESPADDLGADAFDETAIPLLHPADSGPISLGTKHAVHLLRERFESVAETSPSKRAKASVLFQDLLPERTTTRADATKMFFEVLVLATKDAIKVEQAADALGGPLRVRGKRGLWGAWAEREAGGEIEGQDGEGERAAVAA